VGGMGIEGGNPVRNESLEQAVALDGRLRKLLAHHPRFILVRHNPSFLHKITFGLTELAQWSPDSRRTETAPAKECATNRNKRRGTTPLASVKY
jgi:hypothetical protein